MHVWLGAAVVKSQATELLAMDGGFEGRSGAPDSKPITREQ